MDSGVNLSGLDELTGDSPFLSSSLLSTPLTAAVPSASSAPLRSSSIPSALFPSSSILGDSQDGRTLSSSTNNSNVDKLFVRVSQPLVGHDVEAYAIARQGSNAVSGDDPSLTYLWFRSSVAPSTLRLQCAYSRCPTTDSNSSNVPGHAASSAHRSKGGFDVIGPVLPKSTPATSAAAHGASAKGVECWVCAAKNEGRTYFCSMVCLSRGWKEHEAACHSRGAASSDKGKAVIASSNIAVDECSRAGVVGPAVVLPADEVKWEEVGNKRTYRPTNDDVGRTLMLEVRARIIHHGETIFISKKVETEPVLPLPQSPPPRPWLRLPLPPTDGPVAAPRGCVINTTESSSVAPAAAPGGLTLRVISFNILAEIFASSSLYPHCPLWALSAPYRLQLAVAEIIKHKADVICLQELQADALESYVLPALKAAGYKGHYKQKTREAMGGEGKVDGCALFIKNDKLEVLEYGVIEYNEALEALLRAEISRVDTARARNMLSAEEYEKRTTMLRDANRRLMKDNVAQLAIVETKTVPPTKICVVNTHLTWDPAFTDTKLAQTVCLIREVQRIRERNTDAPLPIVLAGDFNSEPGSSIYKFLAENWTSAAGNVDAKFWESLKKQPSLLPAAMPSRLSVRPVPLPATELPADPCEILPSLGSLVHTLPLVSSYAAVTGWEPPYTNYTRSYRGCLDYVWVTGDVIRPVAALAIPHPLKLAPHPVCPKPLPDFLLTAAGTKLFDGGKVAHFPAKQPEALAESLRKSALLVAVSSVAETTAHHDVRSMERRSVLDAAEDLGAARWRLESGDACYLTGVPQMLTEEELFDEDGQILALPSRYFPSDHLALVFDLHVGQQAVVHEPGAGLSWNKS